MHGDERKDTFFYAFEAMNYLGLMWISHNPAMQVTQENFEAFKSEGGL